MPFKPSRTVDISVSARDTRSNPTSSAHSMVTMLLAFSISPMTSNHPSGSVSQAVADAVKVVLESGLPHETNSMFTTIEGEWDEVMGVIKKCVDVVSRHTSRVSLVMKADIRPGYTGEITAKVERINSILQVSGNEETQA